MSGRVIVRGGEIVTATDRFTADVLVEDGKVAALGDASAWQGATIVDATGCLVLPGGIDTHTHLEHRSANGGTRTADDFYTGTVAAAFGGTTTLVDFVRRTPEVGIYDSYQRRADAVSAKAVVDVGLHPIVPPSAGEDDSFAGLVRLARAGATSWKFFMAYPGTSMVDDPVLIRGFRTCAEEGVLPMVHAENGHLIVDATDRLVAEGHTAEHFHHAAHPHVAEREAVHRAATIAERVGSALFVVHVSSRLAADELARARARGLPFFGETCPQYLVSSYEDYMGLGYEAAAYVCSPPIRERANQEHLWRALRDSTIATIGSDHAPYLMHDSDDLPPQKPRGAGRFTEIPNGVPGVEDRMMVMYQAGVAGGWFDVHRFVDLVATRPAKLFGLYPRKGTIAPGSDADLVVWDTEAEHVISARSHHMRTDYNLYEGMLVSGKPRHVLSRGDVIVSGGDLQATAGRGEYVARGTPCLPR